MLRTAFIRSLLVIALLFAQQGALTHAIAHVLGEQSQERSLPHDGKRCDLCESYAQIGGAVTSSDVQFHFEVAFGQTHAEHPAPFQSVVFAAFSARAPPCFA